jgi:hypothetical protein
MAPVVAVGSFCMERSELERKVNWREKLKKMNEWLLWAPVCVAANCLPVFRLLPKYARE